MPGGDQLHFDFDHVLELGLCVIDQRHAIKIASFGCVDYFHQALKTQGEAHCRNLGAQETPDHAVVTTTTAE